MRTLYIFVEKLRKNSKHYKHNSAKHTDMAISLNACIHAQIYSDSM